MILVDTNVLLDLLGNDPVWVGWSRAQLNALETTDVMAINDVVYAELSPSHRRREDLDRFLGRTGVALVQTPRAALFVAGKIFQQYRRSGGLRTGVLPDFFIGAHALVSSARLLTRDPRRYRTYFPGVELITPSVN
ncbi:MAG TPA: PIN domain-containing protein [Stellaceae bacterium]|nr:PIN domain-containing protein [Stellaceae bacterium]